MTPVVCLNDCSCYHRQDLKVNVYDCSQRYMYKFPLNIPNNTEWILFSNSHIKNLPDNIPYLENITKINISSNNLQTIPQNTLSTLVKIGKLKTLDISNNMFSILPKELQH